VLVAHTYNSSYSGGRDQEDHGSKPAQANSSQDPSSKKYPHKKGLAEWLKKLSLSSSLSTEKTFFYLMILLLKINSMLSDQCCLMFLTIRRLCCAFKRKYGHWSSFIKA
jgi:hypothetical protein